MFEINDRTKSVGFIIAGCMFIFLGVVCCIIGIAFGALTESDDKILTIIMCVIGFIYACGGAGMFIAYFNIKKRILMCETYKNIMSGKKNVTLDGLAKTLGITREKVIKDLQYLIGSGQFKYGYIDVEYGVFTLAGDKLEYDKLKHRHIYECTHCGGKTLIYDGEAMICSYCGSPLERANERPLTPEDVE